MKNKNIPISFYATLSLSVINNVVRAEKYFAFVNIFVITAVLKKYVEPLPETGGEDKPELVSQFHGVDPRVDVQNQVHLREDSHTLFSFYSSDTI